MLDRLAERPDPRDPHGVRHALVVVLALTECALLAGVRCRPAVGEWIADASPQVLQAVGARPDLLLPKRLLPSDHMGQGPANLWVGGSIRVRSGQGPVGRWREVGRP
ncbi:transposase family protein [Streptomyces sp. NPDC058964]|uniref:transposase family protein n=1 Tax=Streptomyces sp. NPDC058964 TaxID=3346681 RepID=UPI00368B1432